MRRRIKELAGFPSWLKYEIVRCHRSSRVDRDDRTLFEAIVLIGLVVLVFLQDWRAMILPMIDVPYRWSTRHHGALGVYLNSISLFGCLCSPSALWWTTRLWCWKILSGKWPRA